MDTDKLAGSVKVAILLQSMDGNAKHSLLDKMSDNERQSIENILAQMGPIPPDLVEKVAKEFTEKIKKDTKTKESIPDGKNKKQSEEKTEKSISEPSKLSVFKGLDTDRMIELIKDEHPQTIAIIIAHLDADVGSELLGKLSDDIKTDVAIRVASLGKVISGMVEEIDKVIDGILKDKKAFTTHRVGGPSHLAEVLNQIEGSSGQIILDEIEEINPELAEEIKQMMFVFDDLILIDDKGLQKILRKLESKDLAIALKGASEEVKEKIFRNMSERASEMMLEEIETLGAVRMKDVENSQLAIIKVIQDMEQEGEIVISGRGGEEFIG